MKAFIYTLTITSSLFLQVSAHEGHSHGSTQALHGGSVYNGNKIAIELVQEGLNIKLYPVTLDGKVIPLSQVELSVRVEFPKKKAESVSFKQEADHFSASIDSKGAYRYKIIAHIKHGEVKELITFQVEPQN